MTVNLSNMDKVISIKTLLERLNIQKSVVDNAFRQRRKIRKVGNKEVEALEDPYILIPSAMTGTGNKREYNLELALSVALFNELSIIGVDRDVLRWITKSYSQISSWSGANINKYNGTPLYKIHFLSDSLTKLLDWRMEIFLKESAFRICAYSTDENKIVQGSSLYYENRNGKLFKCEDESSKHVSYVSISLTKLRMKLLM